MSASEFEDQVLGYIWRGLVIAGLLTVLGAGLMPAPSSSQQGSKPEKISQRK